MPPAIDTPRLVFARKSVVSDSLCSLTVVLFPSVFLYVHVIRPKIVHIIAALLRAYKTAGV